MSYCRMGENSDVYLYHDINGKYCCCGCIFSTRSISAWFDDLQSALAHLEKHREAGHLVPQYAIDQVKAEMAYTAQQANPAPG